MSDKEQKTIEQIKLIAIETQHTYGKRRTQVELANRGIGIGIYKTASLMKKANVIAIKPKKRHSYPTGEVHKKADHLLKRQFNPSTVHTHWIGDITYIKTYAVTTASINQGIGEVNVPSNYKWLFPTETTTYTMTAKGSSGTATTCKTIVVVEGQIEQNPPVCELGADPQSIRLGEGSALWWWSDNLSSAQIDNGIGSVTTPFDYTWFFPTQTTTYTMKGVSATGVETNCKITIEVN